MTEYRIGNATVRLHGTPDTERVKKATTAFLKRVEAQRKKEGLKNNAV